jgi:outer membrane usher protein
MASLGRKLFRRYLVLVPAIVLGLCVGGVACASGDAVTKAGADAAPTAAASGEGAASIDGSANDVLQLAVVINDHPTGQIGEFVWRSGELFARSEELQSLGLKISTADGPSAAGLVALAGHTDFSARVEQSTQTLYVNSGNEWLVPTVLGQRASPASFTAESGTGATLNYDFVGTSVDGQRTGSASFDARAFSKLGVLSSGMLVFAGRSSGTSGRRGFSAVRLDSTYVYSDPSTMRRYRVGDLISGALPWTRPVRIGGAQISSDFSMRPDLITFPVPAISGSASVPSTVDVLVNSSHVVSGSVNPGPFQMPEVPVITGGGTVTTTVTDALGRQVVTQLPFYASAALLAPKLQTYSVEIGLVRRNWGINSNDYRNAAASVTYRRGLSSHLTIEAHAEHTSGLSMGGVGAVLNVLDFAEADLAIATSTRSGHAGGQIAAALQRNTPRYSLGASVIIDSAGFRDIAAVNGDRVPKLRLNANASLFMDELGSIAVAYTQIDREGRSRSVGKAPLGPPAPADSFLPQEAEHSKLFTASYSKQIRMAAIYATAFRDFGASKSTTVMVGLTFALGHRTSASVSAQVAGHSQFAQVEVDRSAATPGEWGFRVLASGQAENSTGGSHHAMTGHEFGEVTYKSQFGQVLAGVDHIGGQTTVQGEISGAVSLLDRSLFASNRIDDSFAVVDTKAPGIRVRQENRDVGRTDSRGRLLVADLRSFDINRLAIEPLDAPVDADVPVTAREVRPQDRSGVIVRLPIRIKHSALLRMIDQSGKSIGVGSVVRLDSTGIETPVGYDGEAYLTDLAAHNKVVVEQPDGRRCSVAFNYRAVAGEIPTLGPLSCRESAQ